jgi:head-tail adaptor
MNWPSIDPGRLRHQITIFRQVIVQGTTGPKPGFEAFLTCYAAIEPLTATDVISAGQTTSQLGLPILMNWQAGIEPNMQVEALGVRYIIREILNPLNLNISLTLMCINL